MKERERALVLLRRIERESLYASLLLHEETGFVRTLVLGVLRWRSRLDFAVRAFATRKIEEEVLDVLRVGAYQLLYMDVARHAAVAETVNLAPKWAKGFVNAVLRRLAAATPAEPPDLATRTAHPQWLIERWTHRFGATRAAAIAAADQELSYPDVLASDGPPPDAEASKLVDGVYKLRGSSAELDRAVFWPMDEGSAVVAAMAANAFGAAAAGAPIEAVADLAAAPGSKSRYMEWRGVEVVSNDISISRLMPLRGAGRKIVVSDGRRPAYGRGFRTVLLDAPCSATGTIRKNPEIKWRLRESDLSAFATMQKELLRAALDLAHEVCVYSTCSLEPEENDAVVEAVLPGSGFETADALRFVPAGAAAWVENGVLRLTPESGADGFTAFVLTRRQSG